MSPDNHVILLMHSLMEACYHGQLECAQLLIEHGSSCLFRDYSGFSSLHYAVDGGNINMVNFVLNEGVPVSITAGAAACDL